MKLARRRPDADTEIPDDQPPLPPPPPQPPRGAPVATFAGVLDGRTLWLAVAAAPGSLGLRETGSGDVVALASDLAEDQPDHRSIRVDLADLGATGEATYDVVLVPTGGRAPRPVWSPPLSPATAPAHDGHRWEVRRGDDGLLSLRRSALAPTVELTAIRAEPDGIRLEVEPAAVLVLRGLDGEDGQDGEVTPLPDAMITVAAVAGVPARATRVTTADGRPVVRHDNDLLNPGRSVPLPELYLPGDGVRDPLGLARVRLRWAESGELLAKVLDPEEPA